MTSPFIYINSYTIRPGKEEAYRQLSQQLVELVRENEPRMLYFAAHVSDDGTEAHTIQVHEAVENMAHHMQVLQGHPELLQASSEAVDFSTMSIQIFGTPTAEILEQMKEMAGSGVQVTIAPAAAAFDRFGTA